MTPRDVAGGQLAFDLPGLVRPAMTPRQANALTVLGLAGLLATVALTAPRWSSLLRSPATTSDRSTTSSTFSHARPSGVRRRPATLALPDRRKSSRRRSVAPELAAFDFPERDVGNRG